eukprot:SAG31_NODE_1081_length_10014_cov_16.919617_7_plen_607_part_00
MLLEQDHRLGLMTLYSTEDTDIKLQYIAGTSVLRSCANSTTLSGESPAQAVASDSGQHAPSLTKGLSTGQLEQVQMLEQQLSSFFNTANDDAAMMLRGQHARDTTLPMKMVCCMELASARLGRSAQNKQRERRDSAAVTESCGPGAILFRSHIVGMQHHHPDISVVARDELVLRREPHNKVDPHAIAVCIRANPDIQLGHLRRQLAAQLAPFLDGPSPPTIEAKLEALPNAAAVAAQDNVTAPILLWIPIGCSLGDCVASDRWHKLKQTMGENEHLQAQKTPERKRTTEKSYIESPGLNLHRPLQSPGGSWAAPLRPVHPAMYSEIVVHLLRLDNGYEKVAVKLCPGQLEQLLRKCGVTGCVGQSLPHEGDASLSRVSKTKRLSYENREVFQGAEEASAIDSHEARRLRPYEQLLAHGMCGAIATQDMEENCTNSDQKTAQILQPRLQDLRARYFAQQISLGLASTSRSMGCALALLAAHIWTTAELGVELERGAAGEASVLAHGPPFLKDEWEWLLSLVNARLAAVRLAALVSCGQPAADEQLNPVWVMRHLQVVDQLDKNIDKAQLESVAERLRVRFDPAASCKSGQVQSNRNRERQINTRHGQ